MSSLWEQRAARNQALFREVNKSVASLEEGQETSETQPVFICECANEDCTERLPVDLETYERTREHPRRFLVLPGHEDPQIGRTVERHDGYLIVEKTGEAGDVAERTNP